MNQSLKAKTLILIVLTGSILADTTAACKEEAEKSKQQLSQFWKEDGKRYNLATSIDATFNKVSDEKLVFGVGTFLVESEHDLTIQLPMAKLQLVPKSMALIRIQPGSERIFCLLETLTVECEKRSAALRCGEEALLTDHPPDAGDLSGEFEVGVRQLRAYELSQTRKLSTMEFSLIQTMEREPLLSQITHSKHKHDRFLRDKLIKAAAVLNYVTNRHGPYQDY